MYSVFLFPFRHLVCIGPMQDRTREGLVGTRLFGIFIVSPFHVDCDDTSPVEDEISGEAHSDMWLCHHLTYLGIVGGSCLRLTRNTIPSSLIAIISPHAAKVSVSSSIRPQPRGPIFFHPPTFTSVIATVPSFRIRSGSRSATRSFVF